MDNLAGIYCENGGDLEEALQLAQPALQKDPENPYFADTLGWVYYKIGNYALAIDQLLVGVNRGQPKAENFYHLGMAYYRKGELLAQQALNRALAINPQFKEAGTARQVLAELLSKAGLPR